MTDLSKCTREELIEELCKRGGVWSFQVYATEVFDTRTADKKERMFANNGEWNGPARILVVKD